MIYFLLKCGKNDKWSKNKKKQLLLKFQKV